jgi:integrase
MERTKRSTGCLYRRGKSAVYYLDYIVAGERKKIALQDDQGNPITIRRQAELKRQEILTQAIADAARASQEGFGNGAAPANNTTGVSLANVWSVFVDSANRPDSGPRTLRGYQSQWTQFVEWLAQSHPTMTQMRDVTAEVAEEYAAYMLREIREKQKVRKKLEGDDTAEPGEEQAVEIERIVKRAFTTNTYNKHVRVLELVFRILGKKAGVPSNPWSEIARKTENKASRRELTVEELNTICNKASGELQSLLLLGIYTGLRLGDCCTLRWSEVDLIRRLILRVPGKTARRKGVPVHIPIHQTLLSFLNRTSVGKRSGFVLPGIAAKYERNSSDVTKELREHFVACGIQVHKKGTGEGTSTRAVVEVGFHSLRHSFVSLCRQANAPLAVVEAIVGHSNPAMTRHYTHVGDLAANQAVAALPVVFGEPDAPGEATEQSKQTVIRSEVIAERDAAMRKIVEQSKPKTWKRDCELLLQLLRQGSIRGAAR